MLQKITSNYTDAVKVIKQAILQSRYRAAVLANREMLSLYFGVGEYISQNSRKGFWGTNAIEVISNTLQRELPGLRGFSESNMKYMRAFYEAWADILINLPLTSGEFQTTDNQPNIKSTVITADFGEQEKEEIAIHKLITDEIYHLQVMNLNTADFQCFIKVGFTHHREIIAKAKTLDERLFYIRQCATEFWTVEKLKYNLKADLFKQQGGVINNFVKTPDFNTFLSLILKASTNQ
jgi:predicted nuclease of restriction endonuclease-like (RecB) superfamily